MDAFFDEPRRRIRATIFAASLSLALSLQFGVTSAYCQPQPPPVPHKYQIVISDSKWEVSNWNPDLCLAFDFTVSNTDGTPLTFLSTKEAVKVSGWSDSDFEATMNHSTPCGYDPGSRRWSAQLPGLNPHDKVAHLEFDVEDPRTSAWQSTTLTSDVYFDKVPLPSAWDTPVTVNQTFKTNWGTVITLSSIETDKTTRFGRASTLLNFLIDHTSVPDDDFNFWLNGVYNNGEPLTEDRGMWGSGDDTHGVTVYGLAALTPGTCDTISLDLNLGERAYSPVRTVVYQPVTLDLQLPPVLPSTLASTAQPVSSATIKNVKYTLEQGSGQPFENGYRLWTSVSAPNVFCRITKAAWTEPKDQPSWAWRPTNLTYGDFVQADGSLTQSGELAANITHPNATPLWPLSITSQLMSHGQQLLTFHNIPVPASGSLLNLGRPSDNAPTNGLHLKSISLNLPSKDRNSYNQNDREKPYMLDLTFSCTDPDQSILSLALIAARDGFGNALNTSLLTGFSATENPTSIYADQKVFDVQVPLPATASNTINVKILVTKDTPVGPATDISIDSSGHWTVVGS